MKAFDGAQHLLLRDSRHSIQVLCRGADLGTTPFAMELVIDGFPEIESKLQLMRAMANLYRSGRIGGGLGEWTAEAIYHRNAVIAADLKHHQYVDQDIARFIHGDAYVDEEWSNPNRTLKNRTRNSRKRALRYISGGYRVFLK